MSRTARCTWATGIPWLLAVSVALLMTPALHAQDLEDVDLTDIGYVLGDHDAPIQVVEFGDFACSACAQFWRDTWPRLRQELVETGRVAWRHVPFLLGFPRGDDAANAAECAADQGEFWAMHDLLFEGHRDWTRGRGQEEVFRGYAADIGLEAEAFEECYDDEDGEDRTRAATRAARDAEVRGTPTFFVNGRPAVGALPYDMFIQLIEEAEQGRAGR